MLSDCGVALDQVVGLGSDGENVMVGRKVRVVQGLCQNNCSYIK